MGSESAKANRRRLHDPVWHRVFACQGIDIGAGNDLVTREGLWPNVLACEAFDLAVGDAASITKYRPKLSYDFVYSSHCLEDLARPDQAVRDWWKLVKPGGLLAIVIPDEDLYELGHWPSRFNSGHRWTFTIQEPHGSVHSWLPRSINLMQFIAENFDDYRPVAVAHR